jgi:hypothetical protein
MKLSFFRRSPWYFSGSMPTASEVRAALDRTLGDALVSAGFIAVRSRYWVRQGQGPVRQVGEFTEPLTSDSAVLEAYEAKRRRPTHRFGFENYYQDMLGYAFTLARVGRMTEAEEWLNRSVSIHWPDDADVSRELARLLHAAAGAPQER